MAVKIIGAIGPEAEDCLPRLTAVFKNPKHADCVERGYVSYALLRIGAAAVPYLTAALRDADCCTRVWCASLLTDLDQPCVPAVDDIIEVISKKETGNCSQLHNMRDEAIRALAGILLTTGPRKGLETAVPGLVEGLRDVKPRVRLDAAVALGFCVKDAADIESSLIEALEDPDENVRKVVTDALSRIHGSR
jgi:HEAT repeat protein